MAIHKMAKGWTEKDPKMEVTYAGRVLEKYEVNGSSDSDFKAMVWVPAHTHVWIPEDDTPDATLRCKVEGCTGVHYRYAGVTAYSNARALPDGTPEVETKGFIDTIEYASTRGWTYPNYAEVDATPEVLQQVELLRQAALFRHLVAKDWEAATKPAKGKRVRCTRANKKVPKGTEGVVFWIGNPFMSIGPRNRTVFPPTPFWSSIASQSRSRWCCNCAIRSGEFGMRRGGLIRCTRDRRISPLCPW